MNSVFALHRRRRHTPPTPYSLCLDTGCAEPHYTNGGDMVTFDWLKLAPSDPAAMKGKQAKELKNGRLAMVGIMSFFAASTKLGSVPYFDHLI
jgi:hypothetical protein